MLIKVHKKRHIIYFHTLINTTINKAKPIDFLLIKTNIDFVCKRPCSSEKINVEMTNDGLFIAIVPMTTLLISLTTTRGPLVYSDIFSYHSRYCAEKGNYIPAPLFYQE